MSDATDARTVNVSFTPQEARELAMAAEEGVKRTYVDRSAVKSSCERLYEAATRAESAPTMRADEPERKRIREQGGEGGAHARLPEGPCAVCGNVTLGKVRDVYLCPPHEVAFKKFISEQASER